jgi:hypothetical protein
MAIEIQPPQPIPAKPTAPWFFLAGSIDDGQAETWQRSFVEALGPSDCVILNPRRTHRNSKIEQKLSSPEFRGQVEWELDSQEAADFILMYLAPGTKAPIALMELGLFAKSGKLLVCCPEGFWRRGNVEVICARYQIPAVEKFQDLVEFARSKAQEAYGQKVA